MKTHSANPLLHVLVVLLICEWPSRLEAQTAGTRAPTPPPVPVVAQPAEGQVVTGDLEIAVAVPTGVVARKFTVEAAYWDAARDRWVYPGTLGAEFGGSAAATTRIGADTRVRYSVAATRWRIHVRSTNPPGSWGPWRECSWQGTAVQPGSSRATAAPAPGAGANAVAAGAVPPPGTNASDAAALLAQVDKAIADAKKQIVLLNLSISEENKKINGLKTDILKTEALLDETLKQGMTPDTVKFVATVKALKTHIEDDQNAIYASKNTIAKYQEQIKALEKQILVLQKQREALLALV